jgi:hypothetical protein
VGPVRPAAGGHDLVVDSVRIEAPVVLDPVPEGFVFGELRYDPPRTTDEPARATLYGDPDLTDTLDGPVLLVGTSAGSATISGPPYDVPGERAIDLGGRAARVVPDSDRTWVVFDGTDSRDFVVGRGIDEADLVAAARGADFDSLTRTLAPEAVPAGLEPLVAGSPEDGPGSGRGEHMLLVGESSWVRVHVVRADPRLAALWGFWVDDATGTLVRGRPGSAGDLRWTAGGGARTPGRVWAEDGMVLAALLPVDKTGDGEALLDRVVEGLRLGTWRELEAARHDEARRAPTRGEAGCGPDGGFVSGVEETLRWSFQLRPDPFGMWSTCSLELTSGVGSGGTVVPPPLGRMVATWGTAGVVGGVAPPETARVTVTTPGGQVLEAQLSDVGPRPGERVWGAFVLYGLMDTTRPALSVTAHDGTGAVLDRTLL